MNFLKTQVMLKNILTVSLGNVSSCRFPKGTNKELSTMPNATVRANARALSETTTRRAALGAIIAAGAIGVAPLVTGAASAASGPADLDVGLFTLIDEAREAGARVEAAIGALEEA